jgi:hypothetical protein
MPQPVITFGEHALRLEFGTPTLAGSASGPLPGGGVVTVDPADPGRLLTVEVNSVDLDVLAGVLTVRLEGPPTSGTQSVTAWNPGPKLPAMQRLAFARWYARHTPLDIESPLVMLDVAQAAWEAGYPVAALALFTEHADYLLDQIRGEIGAGGAIANEVAVQLRQTADICATSLGDEDQRAPQLTQAAADLKVSGAPRLQQIQPAFVAGYDQQSSTSNLAPPASVDWDVVPPRTLQTDDGTVLMSQTRDVITVTVPAHPRFDSDAPGAQRLVARLLDSVSGQPLLAAPLELESSVRGGTACFVAEFPAEGVDFSLVIPDVADVTLVRPARIGSDADKARARRRVTRAIAWSRVNAIAASINQDWQQYFNGASHRKQLGWDMGALTAELRSTQLTREWIRSVEAKPSAALTTPSLLSEMMFLSRRIRAQSVGL